jgi:hypothetical protein
LLKNSHLAAVLENLLVRRGAATLTQSLSQRERARHALPLWGRDRERAGLRGTFCGCNDLTIFEQPWFFNNSKPPAKSPAAFFGLPMRKP